MCSDNEIYHFAGFISDGEINTIRDTLNDQSNGHSLIVIDLNDDNSYDILIAGINVEAGIRR